MDTLLSQARWYAPVPEGCYGDIGLILAVPYTDSLNIPSLTIVAPSDVQEKWPTVSKHFFKEMTDAEVAEAKSRGRIPAADGTEVG